MSEQEKSRQQREPKREPQAPTLGVFYRFCVFLAVQWALQHLWYTNGLGERYPYFGAQQAKTCMLTRMADPSCKLMKSDLRQMLIDLAMTLGISNDEHHHQSRRKTELIRKYLAEESQIKPADDCKFGVGYNACTDINFRAAELIKLVEPQIRKMEEDEGKPVEAKVHPEITTLREFIETFAYQLTQGANAERVCGSQDLFYLFLDTLRQSELKYREELGGHSPVWAQRAQLERCQVFIAAQSTPAAEAGMSPSTISKEQSEKYLLWPREDIEKLTTTSPDKRGKLDLHLVFEYAEGDEILGGRFKAPRSNRFYFVHDPNGGKLKQLEIYHKIAEEKYPDIQRHMFGGYQLLQRLDQQQADKRLGEQAALWKKMRQSGDHRIHVEFGDFTSIDFFRVFEKHAVRNANSLGMNEQEMGMLLDYWANQEAGTSSDTLFEAQDSAPSFQDILAQLKRFFERQKQLGLDINRVHLHPYGSFFMCYDKNKWQDARDALLKSALAVPKYCINPLISTNVLDHIDNFDISDDLPESFDHPNKPGEKISITKDNLTYDFDLNDDIYCYLQFFIKCKKVYKTAGMGDTISGTGFIYHSPK